MYNVNNEHYLQPIKQHSSTYVDLTTFDSPTVVASPAINDEYFDDDDEWIAVSARRPTHATKLAVFDSDSYPIGVDSLATACMSHCKEDFIQSTLRRFQSNKQARPYGKGSTIPIHSLGTLQWSLEDDNGRVHKFHIPNSLYIPDGNMRLLLPQHWATEAVNALKYSNKDSFNSQQFWNRNVLTWGRHCQHHRTIYNSPRSNVPIVQSAPSTKSFTAYQAVMHNKLDTTCYTCFDSQIEDNNDDTASILNIPTPTSNETVEQANDLLLNWDRKDPQAVREEDEPILTAITDQAELMRWHYRLGHLSFKKLKVLAENNFIPKRLAQVRPPSKCSSCLYGKMNRKPWRSKAQPAEIFKATKPGECVSVDQMEPSTTGFIGQMKGILTTKRYKYVTVYVDHFSRYTYVHFQKQLTSQETLAGKKAFEAHCRFHNVRVQHYHADNGRFADNMFIDDVREKGQTISFCGVNAHWQNGIAERAIRSIRENARTQILHAIERWPGTISVHLWPFAVCYATQVMNQTPKGEEMETPLSKFADIEVNPNLNHLHAFGCPTYVLDSRLAAQKAVGSWNKRSRLGAYLGPSPRHAKTVSLILNPNNGLVLPQYHVQHDEYFESLEPDTASIQAPWKTLAGFHRQGTVAEPPQEMETAWEEEITNFQERDDAEVETEQEEQNEMQQQSTEQQPDLREEDIYNTNVSNLPVTSTSRRSQRERRRTHAMQQAIDQGQLPITSFKSTVEDDDEYYKVMHEDDYIMQEQMKDPIAFKASSDRDTMYFHQAMQVPDKTEFIQAIVKEINDHVEGNHWELVPASQVPKGTKVLDSVWAMKRKRDIKTRKVYKHKACLNIHGGQQEYGIHFTDTYSPVVTWPAVRLLLILSKLNGYVTKQVDFVLAYPQADIPYDNYMKLPKGITTVKGDRDSQVLKLKKNIYGGRNSRRVWFEYLKTGLENIGFQQSNHDKCVFYRDDVIFFFYVNDGIFVSKSEQSIDKAIADLRDAKKAKQTFKLEEQGDIADYLGINFQHMPDGTLKLWQPHLIDQILEDVGINPRERVKTTPAISSRILKRCKDAPSHKPNFDYRSVIGKLNFLEKSSRPDIAYTVHQCARFCQDPKEEHVKAVIHLAKYLQGTKEEGTTLSPNAGKSFEVWVV